MRRKAEETVHKRHVASKIPQPRLVDSRSGVRRAGSTVAFPGREVGRQRGLSLGLGPASHKVWGKLDIEKNNDCNYSRSDNF